MKRIKSLIVVCLILFSTKAFTQHVPPGYQPLFNEIITNFETIIGSNSISQGKNTLSVLSKDKIALRISHKSKVKNLTFETQPDEEGKLYWIAANALTTDMVNKYEDDLTKILKSMHKLSEKKSQE